VFEAALRVQISRRPGGAKVSPSQAPAFEVLMLSRRNKDRSHV
jgi:hypothetical protein